MNREAVTKVSDFINKRVDYTPHGVPGMDGYVILTLIDENGYPTSSAITISKADGLNWMTFLTSLDSSKAKRIAKNNKASVSHASNNHSINLVGTIEVLTDLASKKAHMQPLFEENHGKAEDENTCVLKFVTQRYSINFFEEEIFAEGEVGAENSDKTT